MLASCPRPSRRQRSSSFRLTQCTPSNCTQGTLLTDGAATVRELLHELQVMVYVLNAMLCFVHNSNSRQQFIVAIYAQNERDVRVEQLQREKERLDYERKFAQQEADKATGSGRQEADIEACSCYSSWPPPLEEAPSTAGSTPREPPLSGVRDGKPDGDVTPDHSCSCEGGEGGAYSSKRRAASSPSFASEPELSSMALAHACAEDDAEAARTCYGRTGYGLRLVLPTKRSSASATCDERDHERDPERDPERDAALSTTLDEQPGICLSPERGSSGRLRGPLSSSGSSEPGNHGSAVCAGGLASRRPGYPVGSRV
jgi:hypothetical protein